MASKGGSFGEIFTFLKGVSLFSVLTDASLKNLSKACRLRSIGKGEIIFFQSDESDAAFVVRSGKVSIMLHSSFGREMVINQMSRGDIFGELGLVTNNPRSTSAITHTHCELIVIPGRTFIQLLEQESRFTFKMLEITATRLQMSGKRESALAFLDAQARLAGLLLELERNERDKGYVTISQDELAQHTGLIRQTVAKALGKWRRAGWLITGRGRILILNRKALEDLERNLLV